MLRPPGLVLLGTPPPRWSKLLQMPRVRALLLRVTVLASVSLALFSLLACSSDDADDASPQTVLQVVVSTQVIADWTREIGGDLVDVRSLVPAGADAHTLELTVEDIRAVADADLVIINGAGLEASYEDAIEENAEVILELAAAVKAMGHELHPFEGLLVGDGEHPEQQQENAQGQQQEEHAHDHGGKDPHFWLDADLAQASVKAIAARLIELKADARDEIEDRRDRYLAAVAEADEEVRTLLADLPHAQRLLFTFHDAFGYFARRYGLTVAGFVVEGPEQGISAQAITELIELIEHEGVATVFHEPQFDSAILDTIADETSVKRRIFWSQPTSDNPTYIDILIGNAKAIAEQ